MTKEYVLYRTKEEVMAFIRQRLSFRGVSSQLRHVDSTEFMKTEHRRFNMSGYNDYMGECTILNSAILNEFADLSIYDYTNYLFLDFYKGIGTLHYQYFNTAENLKLELSGNSTTEIIYRIFQVTIFSGKPLRRR